MTKGILIIALGYDIYGAYAYNLALSLKANDDRTRVCLLYEPSAISRLTSKELDFFDDKKAIPAHEYANGQYHRAKLLAYKYSPYDFTIYMDADTIWIPNRKPADLFAKVEGNYFTIGCNGWYEGSTGRLFSKSDRGYSWWGDPVAVVRYFRITGKMPQTVSGFFAFQKHPEVQKIFDLAISIYDDPNAPAVRWASGKADEYCFNAALGILGSYEPEQLEVFYFDKLNGDLDPARIYSDFWGIAMGGHKCSHKLILLYNKLVDMYSQTLNITDTRFFFTNKSVVIPDRKTF